MGKSVFLGTYNHNLDTKNRLTVPSKVLSLLDGAKSVIVSKGLDGCLELRCLEEFDKYSQKLLTLSQTKLNTRTMLRQLLANAAEIEIDSANRILLPVNLLNEANIKKEVVIIGVGDKCELWDKKTYEDFKSNSDKLLETLVESIDYE